MAESVGKIGLDLGMNYDAFNKELSGMTPKLINMVSGAFGKIGKAAGLIFGAKAMGSFVSSAIKVGSDVAEIQNVVDVTFGAMNREINEFSKSLMENFGLTELAGKKYASTMGAMLKSTGVSAEATRDMSMDLTRLTADLASFYNMDNDEMFQKIMSAMSGMPMPLKQLGINMDAASLEAYALSQGLGKTYSAMNQAEKQMLRYNYLMSITGDQQGDFSRNAHNWAHSLKILSGQWSTLKATMGQGFINILQPLVTGLNKVIAKLITAAEYFKAFTELVFGNRQAAKSTAKDLGYIGGAAGSAGKGMENAGKSAKKAAKEVKGSLSPFDELNTIFQKAAGAAGEIEDELGDIGAVDFGVAESGEVDLGLNSINKQIEDMINNIKKTFPGLFEFFEREKPFLVATFNELADEVRGVFSRLWEQIVGGFEPFKQNIIAILNSIGSAIATIFEPTITLAKNFIIVFLKMFEEMASTAIHTFYTMVEGIRMVLEPGLALVAEIIKTVLDSINEFFSIHMQDIKDLIEKTWETIRFGIEVVVLGIATLLKDIFGGLLEWWRENSDRVKEVLLNTWETIWKGLSTVWNIILDLARNIFEGIKTIIDDNSERIAEIIVTIWDFIATTVMAVWSFLVEVADEVFTALKEFWDKWGEDILAIFTATWDAISKTFGVVLEFILGALKVFIKLFQGDWEGAWEESKKAGERIWNAIKDLLESLWNLLKTLAETIWKGITEFIVGQWESTKKAGETIWNAIKTLFSGIWNAIKSVASTIWESIKTDTLNKWGSIKTGVSNTANALVEAIKSPFNIAKNWINGLMGEAFNWGKNLIGNIVDGINSMIGRVKDSVKKVSDVTGDFLGFHSPSKEGAGKDADKWMPNMMNMLADGIEGNIGKIKNAVGKASETFQDFQDTTLPLPELTSASSSQRKPVPATENYEGLSSILVDALIEALSQLKGSEAEGYSEGSGDIVLKIGETEFGRIAIKTINSEQRRVGKTLIMV